MPDAKEFKVSITHNRQRDTSYSYMPKSILAKLGNPEGLLFVIRDGKISQTSRLVSKCHDVHKIRIEHVWDKNPTDNCFVRNADLFEDVLF